MVSGGTARAFVIDPKHAVRCLFHPQYRSKPRKFVAAMLPLRFARNSKLQNLGSFQWLGVHIQDTLNLTSGCRIATSGWMDGWKDGRKGRPPNKCMYSFYSSLTCSEKNAFDEQKCLTPKLLQWSRNKY